MTGMEMAAAWRVFKRTHPDLFEGKAEGKYLANRLESAFLAGIVAAGVEQRAEAQTRNVAGTDSTSTKETP